MKHLFFTGFFCVIYIFCIAQEDNNEQIKGRLLGTKVSECAAMLKLTPQQTEEFKPIYAEYSKKMFSVFGERKPAVKPATNEEAVDHVKKMLRKQIQIQQIREMYIDKFAKVLDANQIVHLYSVEDQIQKKLKNRMTHPKGNGDSPKSKPQKAPQPATK